MKEDFPKAIGWSTKDVERLEGWRVMIMIDKDEEFKHNEYQQLNMLTFGLHWPSAAEASGVHCFASVSLNKSNAMNYISASFKVFNDILNYSWINLIQRLERITTLFKGTGNMISILVSVWVPQHILWRLFSYRTYKSLYNSQSKRVLKTQFM